MKKNTTIILISVLVVIVIVALALGLGLGLGLNNNNTSNGMSVEDDKNLKTILKVNNSKRFDNVHMIYFYSLGPPNDDAKNLRNDALTFHSIFSAQVKSIRGYNTQDLKETELFPKIFYKTEGPFIHNEHERGAKHGFWTWKSFIILDSLKLMKNGEILFYHDMQVSRYNYFSTHEKPLQPFINSLLEISKSDIFIPWELPHTLKLKHHVKKLIFDSLGFYSDEYLEWPLLNANRIIIRKTDYTIKLIENWFESCLQKILIEPEKEKEPNLRWSTHDQAILSVIMRRETLNGNLPLGWPFIWFKDKIFKKDKIHYYKHI